MKTTMATFHLLRNNYKSKHANPPDEPSTLCHIIVTGTIYICQDSGWLLRYSPLNTRFGILVQLQWLQKLINTTIMMLTQQNNNQTMFIGQRKKLIMKQFNTNDSYEESTDDFMSTSMSTPRFVMLLLLC